ncbi:MAG: hypothetical protein QHC67_01215 [Sphingobium sp.]|uniref:DUF6950 family protein n=1 Tax=Sphingobium sp. TaxID=1912891 RepID=UPI0029B353B3|nr:hypothetical protein [Sphingobium sp.]MDX3908427.1 hypothetical protein [Sphingobium sp.]
MKTPLERRHAAIEATMAKYRDRPFAWGKVDCARVGAFHLKQLGHKISISRGGSYTSALGAQRAIKKFGVTTLPELIESLGLTEIPYSRMLLGDLAQIEGDSPIGTIGIYTSNGNLFGFHQDHPGLVTLQPHNILRAWSVL